jgi:hypothetical protein
MLDTLTLLPLVQARRVLGDAAVTLAVLRPPFPALGVGTLRVLRVRERESAPLEITAGYDNYERLG